MSVHSNLLSTGIRIIIILLSLTLYSCKNRGIADPVGGPLAKGRAEIIREKALRLLKDEVPHGIAVSIVSFKERADGLVDIEADIICEKDSHKGIIIGKGGSMLKKIGIDSRKDIEELIETHVNLRLFVKVRRDWRQNAMMLKDLGYTDRD